MGTSSTATWAIAAAIALNSCEAFAPSSFTTRTPALRHGARLSVSMKERKDGASQKDVDAAWETHKELMKTKNSGKGYWMDSRMQFFTNIKTAFDRNFGDKKIAQVDLPDGDGKVGMVDLAASPFKPLLSEEDMAEYEAEMASTQKAPPTDAKLNVETKAKGAKGAAPAKKGKATKKKGSATKTKVTAPAAAGGDDDVESKMAAMEAAKKAKAEEAAALKKMLEDDE